MRELAMMSRLSEWWRARKRGEVRQGSKQLRGRVYAKTKVEPPKGDGIRTTTEPFGSISARIQRVGSDEWEDLGVISKSRRD